MSFLSLLIAFLLEQIQPLPSHNPVYATMRSAAAWAARHFNAGRALHGAVAWIVVVLLPALGLWGFSYLLAWINPLFAFCLHVLILYLTLGFRQFSHHFTAVQLALSRGDLDSARASLQLWRARELDETHKPDTPQLTDQSSVIAICRAAIEEAIVASHRHVFGVLFWYAVLPGPVGPVLYRLAGYVAQRWNTAPELAGELFGRPASQFFAWLDWLPVRLSALGFAIVGNFEDAMFGWRNRAPLWNDTSRGLLVESAGGALGVRLGPPLERDDAGWFAVPPSLPSLQATVGLLWRAVVLWMLLVLIVSTTFWIA